MKILSRRSHQYFALALCNACSAVFGQVPAESFVLLEKIAPAAAAMAAPLAVTAQKSGTTYLKLRTGALGEELWKRPQNFVFPLGATVEVTTVPRTVSQTSQGNWTHIGSFVDDPSGSFVLATNGNLVYGTIRHKERVYILQPFAPGVFMTREVTLVEGDCGTPEPGFEAPLPAASKGNPEHPSFANPNPDDGSIIDLMVVFTDNVRQAVMPGGSIIEQRAAAYLAIDAMIAQTNDVYAVSGIVPRVRLVDRIEVNYAESGFADTDLNALRGGTNRFSNIATRRESYRADVVALIVEGGIVDSDGATLNGKAFQVMSTETTAFRTDAFFISRRDPATAAWTFAHELGHLQGCRHDQINGPGCGGAMPTCCAEGNPSVFPYSWGWQYTVNVGVPPAPQIRRTVMVRSCQNGTRQGRFSNPNILDLGVATGSANANNALAINNTADTVAEFARSRFPDIYSNVFYFGTEIGSLAQPFNTFEEGVNHTILGGTLHFLGGTYISSDTLDLDPNDGAITIDRRITLVVQGPNPVTITR